MYSTNEDSLSVPSIVSSYTEKAATLTQSLDAIMSICECRCKLITIQEKLLSSEKLDLEKIVSCFQTMLTSLPNKASKAITIVSSTSQEVECWYNIMKIYLSLGKLRYVHNTSSWKIRKEEVVCVSVPLKTARNQVLRGHARTNDEWSSNQYCKDWK